MAGEERDLTNRDDSRPVRVKVDNVKKIYNTRNGEMVALNGVTLDIHDNEFICVVGPSGCGQHDPRPARSLGAPCAARCSDRTVNPTRERKNV